MFHPLACILSTARPGRRTLSRSPWSDQPEPAWPYSRPRRLFSRCLRSVFSVFFEMLLRPFMPAVATLVQVLELFNINDHRFALMESEGSIGASPCANSAYG